MLRKQLLEDKFDYKWFHGEILDQYDLLSNDEKDLLRDTKLGKIIEKRLQETDNY